MLSTATEIYHWQFDVEQLADPELVDRLILSLCDTCGINYPHFKLQLLVSELVSNAIDHGVLSLSSHMKDSSSGYESYLIERSKRLSNLSSGSVFLSAEWVGSSVLRISVEDSGAGFDFATISYNASYNADLSDSVLKLYGRGLAIISNLCESVVHRGNGNCTEVEFDVAPVA